MASLTSSAAASLIAPSYSASSSRQIAISSFLGSSSALKAAACSCTSFKATAPKRRANTGVRAAVSVEAPKPKTQYGIQAFTNWLLLQEQAGVIDNEMTIVLSSISLACKQIASLVNRAGISNLTGAQGATNVQGEDQKKLDVISNEVFAYCLRASGRTGIIASEEEDIPVAIAVEETFSGNYVVVFDPLDGSSNIDAAVSTGSIFGIYREPEDGCLVDIKDTSDLDEVQKKCITNVCQPGKNLLAAGYCMYSSSTILVLSVGNGVYGFTLDPMYGEFVLTHDNIQIPKSGKIYSFNEGNYELWSAELKKYISDLKDPGPSGKPYSARYIGSLVGDFHRTMLYGGIYGYPPDSKNVTGKLRLLYECAPMSFLAEQAGGKGSDGYSRILDIVPDKVHQRVPLFVGSVDEVDKVERYLAQ